MTFEKPDAWHMPAAYWFWHEMPGEEQIRRQVGQMQDAGILSFQVQARMAFPIENYLTEEYLAACRIAVDEAAKRGMMVGVYDDYNWQTGHAAGRAVAGHDELRERQLFWTSGVVGPDGLTLTISDTHTATESLGDAGMAWHYDRSVVEWADWNIEFVVTGTGSGARDELDRASFAASDLAGCSIAVTGLAEGTPVTVFVSARCATSRLVNFVDEAAAARFVEAGYQPFYDALGDYFGSTITYFFFDQPHANYYRWAERHGNLGSAIPFHSSLGEAIRAEWTENYSAVLLSLLEAADAQEKALRAQFYDFFSQRSMQVFLGAMHEWTSSKGVLLSGHEVLAHVGQWNLAGAFDEWDLRVNFGLDYFGIDSYRDLTGVDGQDSVPQLSEKLGDSVARYNGRSGTILEQYYARSHTGSGVYAGHWGLTLEEMRAQALRHHILGMRQFLFHGFYQTHGHDDDPRMFSNPRFDFPPGVNFEPWFDKYHASFAIESGRVSEFLDDSEPTCEIAVFYPLRTVWAEGQGAAHADQGGAWYEALAIAGYGYHLIDERDLHAATVEPGALRIGDRSYRALVLPGVTTLRSAATIARIRELSDAGVIVVASGETPSGYQHGPQTAPADWSALGGGVQHLPTAPAIAELPALLGEPGRDAVTVTSPQGHPWSRSGRHGDTIRVAVFNDTHETMPVNIALHVGGLGSLESWSVSEGTVESLPFDGSAVSIDLEPMQVRLLVFAPGASDSSDRPGVAAAWSAPALLAETFTLDVPTDAHAHAGERLEVHANAGWEGQGLPDFSGIARYTTTLELPSAVEIEILLPSVSGGATVTLNGASIGSRGWSPYRFVGLAAAGTNEVVIEIASPAANRYYAGTGMREAPERAGLLAPPTFRTRPTT